MKTKRITAKFPIAPQTVDAATTLTEEYENGEEDIFSFYLNENDTEKIDIVYFYADEELKYTFYDPEFAKGYSDFISKQVKEGKIYIGHPIVSDIRKEGMELIAELIILMPWENNIQVKDIPEQEYVPVKKDPEPVLIQTTIVGINHQVAETKREDLEQEIMKMPTCRLKTEPDNPYDPNAVAVYLDGFGKVGYITKEDAGTVAGMINGGNITESIATFMEYGGNSIKVSIQAETDTSQKAASLFSHYTPMAVYKANYFHRFMEGKFEQEEEVVIDWKNRKIDFGKFAELSITSQDRLAELWAERMVKADVPNPDNPKWRMNVRLDLADYGTNWKELDLTDELLLKVIGLESKMLAIYIRARRKGFTHSPENFAEVMDIEASESLIKRMHYEYDNNRL